MALRLSFRFRVVVVSWAWFVLALFPALNHYFAECDRALASRARDDARRQLEFMDYLLRQGHAPGGALGLQEWVRTMGKQSRLRITYVGRGGRVIADSELSSEEVADLDRHVSRPEIMGAGELEIGISTRYSATMGTELLYAAKKVEGFDDLPPGVLRIAVPLLPVPGVFGRFGIPLLWILAGSLAALSLVAHFATRRYRRVLEDLSRASAALASGDLHQRFAADSREEALPAVQSMERLARNLQGMLRESSRKDRILEAVTEEMSEAFLLLDADGRVRRANQRFCDLFPGSVPAEGHRPLELVRSPELQEAVDEVLRGKDLPGDPGSRRPAFHWRGRSHQAVVIPIREEGETTGAVALFTAAG